MKTHLWGSQFHSSIFSKCCLMILMIRGAALFHLALKAKFSFSQSSTTVQDQEMFWLKHRKEFSMQCVFVVTHFIAYLRLCNSVGILAKWSELWFEALHLHFSQANNCPSVVVPKLCCVGLQRPKWCRSFYFNFFLVCLVSCAYLAPFCVLKLFSVKKRLGSVGKSPSVQFNFSLFVQFRFGPFRLGWRLK